MSVKKMVIGLGLVICFVSVSGCGTNLMKFYLEDLFESGSPTEASADQLAWKGVESFRKKKYGDAQKAFQKLIEQYPYSKHVLMAELKLGDAYYLDEKYAEAAVAYEQFARLHPGSEVVPYVLYQLGMSYFNMGKDVDKDHEQLNKALSVFDKLARAYPQTPYAQKATKQAQICKHKLIEHEIYVSTFYFKRGKYTAAKKRLEYLLSNYLSELSQINQLQKAEEMLRVCNQKIGEGAEQPSIWTRVGF